jgi:hypothetical protein
MHLDAQQIRIAQGMAIIPEESPAAQGGMAAPDGRLRRPPHTFRLTLWEAHAPLMPFNNPMV